MSIVFEACSFFPECRETNACCDLICEDSLLEPPSVIFWSFWTVVSTMSAHNEGCPPTDCRCTCLRHTLVDTFVAPRSNHTTKMFPLLFPSHRFAQRQLRPRHTWQSWSWVRQWFSQAKGRHSFLLTVPCPLLPAIDRATSSSHGRT